MPGSPSLAQRRIDLPPGGGHQRGGFPPGGLKLRVTRNALAVRHNPVKLRPRRACNLGANAHDVGLRQLACVTGTDTPGLRARLAGELQSPLLSSRTIGHQPLARKWLASEVRCRASRTRLVGVNGGCQLPGGGARTAWVIAEWRGPGRGRFSPLWCRRTWR